MKRIKFLMFISILMLLSACAGLEASPTMQAPVLKFIPKMTMVEEGQVHFELGVINDANHEQLGIQGVDIRAVVTNEEGKIRNQMTIVDLGPIPEDTSVYPMTYDAMYDPGKYEMTLTGEYLPSLTLAFEVREEDGILKLAASHEYIDPHTGFTVTDPDL